MTIKQHSRLGPSKAHRWLACQGSIGLDLEDGPESTYAEDGQLGHAILSLVLKGTPVLTGDEIQIGKQSYPAPAERIQQAIEIRDFVRQWSQTHPDFVMESEVPLKISRGLGRYGPNGEEPFDGTADIIAYNQTEAVIIDAKFGFVRVEPENNPQLYLYAIGLLYEVLAIFGEVPQFVTVIIAQPNYEGLVDFREHRMRSGDLLTWAQSMSAPIARAYEVVIEGKPGTFSAHSDYACRYCPGRNTCQTRIDKLRDFAYEEWRMTHTLAELLPLLPQIRNIADDLERAAVKMLAAGESVPGYKLVEASAIRKWTNDSLDAEDGVVSLAKDKGLDIVTKKLMSPAQVEKAYGAEGKDFTKTWAFKPKGGPKLVPDSDKREPYAPKTFTQEEIDALLREE
jgi:hypothetical protein